MRYSIITVVFLILNFSCVSQAKILSIDSLKEGSKYIIYVVSNGCFHHTEQKLVISRNSEGYFAVFNVVGKIEEVKIRNSFKKMKLSERSLDSLQIFEKELVIFSKQKYDCTTVDTYYLNIDNVKSDYTVDNCNWNGMGKLIYLIFGRYNKTVK